MSLYAPTIRWLAAPGVTLEDLEDYPFLSYEQGSYNSFYYSEELTSTFERRKNIRVRDRATLFNLVMGPQRLARYARA